MCPFTDLSFGDDQILTPALAPFVCVRVCGCHWRIRIDDRFGRPYADAGDPVIDHFGVEMEKTRDQRGEADTEQWGLRDVW